jgi:hypothetical protein
MPTLYHFTGQVYLPALLRDGISKGDVATEPNRGFNAPWLTSNPHLDEQRWGTGSTLNKTAVRCTVEIPEGDDALWSWDRLVREYEIPDYWVNAMTTGLGEKPEHWYIYMGVIPPAWIREVVKKPGLEPFDPSILPEVVTRLEHPGPLGVVVDAVWVQIPRDAFLESLGEMPDAWSPMSDGFGLGKSGG